MKVEVVTEEMNPYTPEAGQKSRRYLQKRVVIIVFVAFRSDIHLLPIEGKILLQLTLSTSTAY